MRTVGAVLGTVLALAACDDTTTIADAAPSPGPDAQVAPADCAETPDTDGDGVCDGVAPDWTREARLEPGTDRRDLFQLGDDLPALVDEGLLYAQQWPVTVSGVWVPWRMVARTFDPDEPDPALQGLRRLSGQIYGFDTIPAFYDWLGLVPYNPPGAEGPFHAPVPEGLPPGTPMGASIVETEWGRGLTFACTACHASRLLGRTVVGLGNKRSRANAFFSVAHRVLPALKVDQIRETLGLTEGEIAMLDRSLAAADSVASKPPEVLGLDTSLAHTSLSLARRGDDPHATPSAERQARPAETLLDTLVADSKPMPWWTAKYKTRWLSDGSIVGNPIIINLLWNEIGRGTDLRELDGWIDDNRRVIDALNAAVFANEAPRWTDYFAAETIDLPTAQRGQALFAERCASCHGTYEKAWDGPEAAQLSAAERLATTRVVYHAQTPVMNVGTDAQRVEGLVALHDQVQRLHLYTKHNIESVPSSGYVPPPLEGIWARYPYLHNNSVPTLCDLLSPVDERPAQFRQGPSEDAETDFDVDCVGYPVGEAMPAGWADIEDSLFDTANPGLSNRGHDEQVWGGPLLPDERRALVTFLKTL